MSVEHVEDRPLVQRTSCGQQCALPESHHDASEHHHRATRLNTLFDRLSEYGWKPHRVVLGSNKPITGLNVLVYA